MPATITHDDQPAHDDEPARRLFSRTWRLGVTPWQFVKELYAEIAEDGVVDSAAALGFYLMLAVFPAVIFVMALLPYLPVPNLDEAIMDLLRQGLPPGASEMFVGVVQEVTKQQRGGLLSFGALATLWATSSGMAAVMQELNKTYDVDEGRGFIQTRLVAIALSLLFAGLVIGGFSLIVAGGTVERWLGNRFGLGDSLLTAFAVLRWIIILSGLLLAFALIYFLAPNVKQRFVYITPGSVAGVAALAVASLGFAWYVRNFGNYSATYGSIGTVIVLMLWLYIAGLAILLGSEVNALIEHHSPGGKVKGEHAPGERKRSIAVRRRTEEVAPERHR